MALILSGDTGPSFVQNTAMPAGSVIQTVNYAWTTISQSTSSTSYVDTGLVASITPISTSSKIIIIVSLSYELSRPSSRGLFGYQLLRNSAALYSAGGNSIGLGALTGTSSVDVRNKFTFQYYDSPATTSAIAYKLQVKVEYSDENLNMNPANQESAITLLEIKG